VTRATTLLAAFLIVACLSSCPSRNHVVITQAELVRNTQELFDATAAGDPTPWVKYFAEDSMYFDEKGRSMDKPALVKDVSPLPAGYSGSIKLVNPRAIFREVRPSSPTTWMKPRSSLART
jgi:hypothetical protein